MTTEALKSTNITNRDSIPSVQNSPLTERGQVKEVLGSVTTTSGKTSGSTYRMCSIPSNCRVSEIFWQAVNMTQGSFDVGLYRTTADGAAVVDADFFATAVAAAGADIKLTPITNESGTYTPALQEQPIWQAVGMSVDPKTHLDVVFTSTNTITSGQLLGVKVRYIC